MMMPSIKKNIREEIYFKVGRKEFEVSPRDPNRDTHFIFGILKKTTLWDNCRSSFERKLKRVYH